LQKYENDKPFASWFGAFFEPYGCEQIMASIHVINSSARSLEEYEAEGIKVGIDVTYQETAEGGARAIP